jgi:MFS family permease
MGNFQCSNSSVISNFELRPKVEARSSKLGSFGEVIRDQRVQVLLTSVALFHLANSPAMPLVAQKVTYLGGSSSQVAGVVLAAQAIMIPVALAAGCLGDALGRKPVFAFGFVVLPVRIASYALADNPNFLIALQTLDGIGAGIFGVTAVAMCADLTRERGHFNGLVGIMGTAGGIGGVVGPFVSGVIVQHFGFEAAFISFAAIAAAGALLFSGWMPETRDAAEHQKPVTSLGDFLEPETT